MKTYKISALCMMCLVLLSSLSFTACNNGDDLDTNQYKGGVSLNIFGPSPVARGGILRFLGSGLDKVTEIVLPGCDPITDIEVISSEEIRIEVPQNAQPGYVTLKSPEGEITTKTKLTYTEPISLESINPMSIKPNQTLTIKGEYLNLIKEIIFTENVTVTSDKFIEWNRKEIKLVVPEEAKSGKIIISDGAEIPNWIYSDEEVNVILPSTESVIALDKKKPGDVITITGNDLDLVKKVEMPNGTLVEFVVKDNTITFTLPENISDGAVVMIPASGVKVAIATIGVAVPSEVKATPSTGLRAGDEITLSGVNMELVTNILFPSVSSAVSPISKSVTEVKVAMPAAGTSGNIILNTASGAKVPVNIATAKPEFAAFENSILSLGSSVKLTGKNLDLVTKVIFTGGAEVAVNNSNAAELTIAMPTSGSETGKLTLVMANGESAETGVLTINAPLFCYVPSLPTDELKSGSMLVLNVENETHLKGVQLNGVNAQYVLLAKKLSVGIPVDTYGDVAVKLISDNGSVEYHINVISSTKIEVVVFEGPKLITWGDGGRVMIPAASFVGVRANSKIKFFFTQKDQTWAQAQINYGNWSSLVFPEIGSGTLVPTDMYGWTFDSRILECTLTQEILDKIQANKGNCEDQINVGVIIQGSDLTFTKVTIVK
ncbi:hypothetical protein [Phocaeicola paurosaccharolyticus]|uniref:hypothetical protein n=1 Tax=Phocaeicola paurosaccharolyticus TaxID=732242 RepID=UPI000468A89D|nr:hypothetical protein [Phocaeicola paurosaccharolyticus]